MHALTLFSLTIALKSTLIASQAEDLFSSNAGECVFNGNLSPPTEDETIYHSLGSSANIAFNPDLFPSGTEQTISDLKDPASNSNELFFDSPSLDYDPNIPISDLNRYATIATNTGFDDPDLIANSALLESFCQVEENGQINDVLRARDNPACKTEDFNLPLDFGTDSWWRRIFPARKPAPKPGSSPLPGVLEPDNVPMISPEIYKGFFNEVDEERRCPKEFPIRCCSGYVMGYQAAVQYRTIYFIGSEDCVPGMVLQDSTK